MKRHTQFCPLMATLFMVLAACTPESNEQLPQGNEIKLTSIITSEGRGTNQNLQSTEITQGQQVGITILGASKEHTNVCWTAGENGELKNTGATIFWTEKNVTIHAYHPYQSKWTNNNHTFFVQTDQSTNEQYLKSDLLWAETKASITNIPINLAFTHKLSKINVTLSSDDIADLSNATISICDTNIATGFNPETGMLFATTSNTADIKASITTNDSYTASAIIVPQIVAKGTKMIKIVKSNKAYYYTLSSDIEFKSGCSYHFQLNIEESNIENPSEDEETDW